MVKNKKVTFGVFYRSSASAPVEQNSTHSSLLEAEVEAERLFEELSETLSWPGWDVWIADLEPEVPTWPFDNRSLKLR